MIRRMARPITGPITGPITRPITRHLACMLVGAACLAAGVALGTGAGAVEPDEILSNPGLEARARVLSRNIRCLVCQNQSIDDSDADLARDLRQLVRARLIAGDSDREIEDFLVARYGDFILLRPPLRPETWLLWFGPLLVLGSGVAIMVLTRRNRTTPPRPLDETEARRLADLLRPNGLRPNGLRPNETRGDGVQGDGVRPNETRGDGPV